MPLYEYRCKRCRFEFDLYRRFKDSDKATKCPDCNEQAQKVITLPNIQTDANFFATGHIDPRICEDGDDRIKGRKDWQRRLKEKGLRELDWAEVKNPKMPEPAPIFNDII